MDQQITEGVIWKQILIFFFPIMLGAFFQQMYFTADTIIVGRFVGTQALAAVGSTGALVNLINAFSGALVRVRRLLFRCFMARMTGRVPLRQSIRVFCWRCCWAF